MWDVVLGLMGSTLMAVIGWGFRLANRMAVAEANHANLLRLIDAQLDDIRHRLDRIEALINHRQ